MALLADSLLALPRPPLYARSLVIKKPVPLSQSLQTPRVPSVGYRAPARWREFQRFKEALQKYPEQSFAQKFGLCNR